MSRGPGNGSAETLLLALVSVVFTSVVFTSNQGSNDGQDEEKPPGLFRRFSIGGRRKQTVEGHGADHPGVAQTVRGKAKPSGTTSGPEVTPFFH